MTGSLALLSACAPLAGLLPGVLVTQSPRGTDMASGLGAIFRGCLALSAVGLAGEATAVAAMYRAEKTVWLCWMAIVVNGLLTLPGLFVLLNMDRD